MWVDLEHRLAKLSLLFVYLKLLLAEQHSSEQEFLQQFLPFDFCQDGTLG